MQAHELDTAYSDLAQAIAQAGAQSELYLAMLCLKLIAGSSEMESVQLNICTTLAALQSYEH